MHSSKYRVGTKQILGYQSAFSYWSTFINPFLFIFLGLCDWIKGISVGSLFSGSSQYFNEDRQWMYLPRLPPTGLSWVLGPSALSSCFFWLCISSQSVVTWLSWCRCVPPTSYTLPCTSSWAISLSRRFGIPQLQSLKSWLFSWGKAKLYHLPTVFCRCTLFSHWAVQSTSSWQPRLMTAIWPSAILYTMASSAQLALGSWVCDFMAIAIPKILMSSLSFCGPHTINHFFCDIALWITLACNSTWAVELVAFVIAFVVILHSCIITLVSYVYIISTILRIPSAKGRRKAFSTFSSHFIVVLIWYESTIILHVCTSIKEAFDLTKAVHVLNTVVTPVLNPFIYTLHNKEVRESLMRNGRENKLPPTKMTSVNCLHTCPGVLSKNMKKKSKSSLIQEEEKLEKKSKQIKNSFYLPYFLICDRN